MTQVTYRRLGRTGLKVSNISLGVVLIKLAYERGINFFDNAEIYGLGQSEVVFSNAIKNNAIKREDIVVTTKVFWGTGGWGPNANGLSKKHIIEGLNASLERLQLDYVDVVYAHLPDPDVTIEEVVRAFNFLISQGKTFYWGTSEWSAQQITEAHVVAQRLGLEGPAVKQPEYNLFQREKIEKEYVPIYDHFGLGTTTWSPLASGILTGKYNDRIPEGSRFSAKEGFGKILGDKFRTPEGQGKAEKVRKLTPIAEKLGATPA
ncbi:Aldo/keto reductase [Conidiobolus coronatus NRRL 28638]|uniref:Aldo/keto reductase n=1 Tax=Conidiobolus coronatus (strain ATCC 28846 / CBS 209.66 / NRRL 28638) TaxID=796925 RepID=A0A137NQC8_CONC2|nr:Aldo/keto reductase [Conidiobolus coronatus NRRL 28638]|eukprot:KXN64963.1 Aldo/keto reductase [Conidiobolus coronatus NRRL 28638]